MAKKTRRPNIPESTLERARREVERDTGRPATPPADVAAPSGEAAAVKPRRIGPRMSSADLRAEYEYVVSDLQNMGILAAVFLGALIVLSFFL
jgi:hypothetical protein